MAIPGATVSARHDLARSIGQGQGIQLGLSASDKVGFYGTTPIVQRAYSSAVHATSAQATSTDFGATQLATLQEIMKLLQGVGLMPTS
jgi:hypothetical protein